MSHYSRYNITAEAEAVTTHGFHALAFMAEAAIFTYLGADFLLSDFDAEACDWRLVTPPSLLKQLVPRSDRSQDTIVVWFRWRL